MAKRRTGRMRVASVSAWSVTPVAATGGRRAAAAAPDPLVAELEATGQVEAVGTYRAELPRRRGVEDQPLVVDVEPPEPGSYVVLVRHASGAITVSPPETIPARRGGRARRAGSRVLRFRIVTHSEGGTPEGAGRRWVGKVIGKAVKFVVVKVVGKMVDAAIEKLARLWEARVWKKKNLPRGLMQVMYADGQLSLVPLRDPALLAGGRNLLFIHGTFSHFESGFGALVTTQGPDGRTFFDAVADVYGERIYAFNHFSVSETPLENASQLLEALPKSECTFDAITHSRGALVLRALVEQPDELGAMAQRFRLGNAVLVAGPNGGTPLASPERWETFTGWLATLVDLLPDNPFSVAVEFIAEALGWIAQKVGGVIPGLAAMNPNSPFIKDLQEPPHPGGRLSALVANFEPDASWLARLGDAAVDTFFATANDLVVPSEGGWRVDANGSAVIPGDRIGCFGPGGNLRPGKGGSVHHCNFFVQPETVEFLTRGVRGEAQTVSPLDPARDLSTPLFGRRGVAGPPREPAAPVAAVPAAAAVTVAAAPVVALPRDGRPYAAYALDEILNLFILVPDEVTAAQSSARPGTPSDFDAEELAQQVQRSTRSETALMIASFRNARVYEPFRTKGGSRAGSPWQQLIAMHRRIKGYVDGDPNHPKLPDESELRRYGSLLFTTLFPGQVSRLYDAARAELRDRRLDICLTSTIGWVADIPWEFAFDPSRQMFLCMEEVNFLRNISTAVPADAMKEIEGRPLRILVVAAQPVGAGSLSIAQEEEVIRRSFRPLTDARPQLAEVDVLTAATPELLHQWITLAEVNQRPYDVLHFIGHGEFDRETGFGYLLFEDGEGRSYELRADHFRQIVARRGIRLVFLNACETGTGFGRNRPFDFAQGAAPMLVAGGVPAVVANQFKVLDPSAVAFSKHFYWALANGRRVGDAAREARVAVNYAIAGEAIDWAVPVLFARNPADRVTTGGQSAPLKEPVMAPGAGGARRRARTLAGERVAIWDVNYVVPELEQIVQRLNQAQRYFEFLAVDMPAPLGTWRRSRRRRETPAAEGTAPRAQKQRQVAYLEFGEVVAKLKEAPKRFSVDHLFCLTDLPLADEGEEDMLTSQDDKEPISIGSTWGLLSKLPAPGLSLQRLVVNFLLFNLTDLPGHRRDPKDCVAYYNQERDIRWIAGPSRFCERCLKLLPAGPRRDALVALTTAFSGT